MGREMLLLFLLASLMEAEGTVQVTAKDVNEPGIPFSLQVYEFVDRGDTTRINASKFDDIRYFCHKGRPPTLSQFWASASFKLDLPSADYQVYIGPNLTSVHYLHQQSEAAWFYTQLPWRSKEFKFSPFEDTCVAVKTSHEYSMTLLTKQINYMMLIFSFIGIFAFFTAPNLCRNPFFHFATGISAGVILSVLILTYLVQRKMRVSFFSWIGLLYSLSLYFITTTWYNLKDYLTDQYFHWVVGYILCAGILSFAIVYRMGAPTNPRTVNLIQWSMQAVSLICIVLSSYHQVASLSLALLLLGYSLVPSSIKATANTRFRKTFFRPKVKLLSEEEFIAQGNEETRKALEDLRRFCRSPESKPWQTVTKLRSPCRFAEFMEGSPHITEDEVMEYSHWDAVETDDDDDRVNLTDDEGSDIGGAGDRSFDGQTDF